MTSQPRYDLTYAIGKHTCMMYVAVCVLRSKALTMVEVTVNVEESDVLMFARFVVALQEGRQAVLE